MGPLLNNNEINQNNHTKINWIFKKKKKNEEKLFRNEGN